MWYFSSDHQGTHTHVYHEYLHVAMNGQEIRREFGRTMAARAIVEAWREDYNTVRPHSALDDLTPNEFAQKTKGNIPAGLH